MTHLELQPEIEAQLFTDARSRGITIEKHLEQLVTGKYPEYDSIEATEGIRRGLADVAAGRTRPAEDVFAELGKEYGLQD